MKSDIKNEKSFHFLSKTIDLQWFFQYLILSKKIKISE